jgi:hypothetical protein
VGPAHRCGVGETIRIRNEPVVFLLNGLNQRRAGGRCPPLNERMIYLERTDDYPQLTLERYHIFL